jgi:hypothetical protein
LLRVFRHPASDYQPGDDVSTLAEAVFAPDGVGGLKVLSGSYAVRRRGAIQLPRAPVEVPGTILRRAVGVPLAEYLSTRIWKKLGAEGGGGWDVDPTGGKSPSAAWSHGCGLGKARSDAGARGRMERPAGCAAAVDSDAPPRFLEARLAVVPTIGYGYQVWLSRPASGALQKPAQHSAGRR